VGWSCVIVYAIPPNHGGFFLEHSGQPPLLLEAVVAISHAEPTAHLELIGDVQLFMEPIREWVTFTLGGIVHPIHLADRSLPFIEQTLDAAEDDDIVLTIDCVGVDWEVHLEFTKKGLAEKTPNERLTVLHDLLPRRFDEYLSTTFNIIDTATLFASATDIFGDAHALISVPFREVRQWITGESPAWAGSSAREQITEVVSRLADRLGQVEKREHGSFIPIPNWHTAHDLFAHDLMSRIVSRR